MSDEAGSKAKLIGDKIGPTSASGVAAIGRRPKLMMFDCGLAARCGLDPKK